MQLSILAFVFGVLLFLMSAAALALEPMAEPAGIWRLALLLLAALHAASGFVAIGGATACAEGRWSIAAGCATAGAATTIVATVAAFQLAARYQFVFSRGAAIFIVIVTLAAGTVSVVLVILHGRESPTEA
jgi:hypothetical protein